MLVQAPKLAEEFVIPPTVETINANAFAESIYLKEIVIPPTVKAMVINGKIDEIYATAPVDNCIFGEISVPHRLGDYYRNLWYYHSGSIKERNEQ